MAIVLVLLCVAWFVSLQLTKQRIQLEAENRLNNLTQQKTPYIWDFESFENNIVESFQKYWQNSTVNSQIKSNKGVNPQLSLNFSGETINISQFSELIISSPVNMIGSMALQAKINLDDDVYYYLLNIKLTGKVQKIHLHKLWSGVNANETKIETSEKNKKLEKISSLVLIFKNPNQDIVIDSIAMPYLDTENTKVAVNISCAGEIQGETLPKLSQGSTFNLSENCLFSSNYLWLKHKLQNSYPSSILFLNDVRLWQQTGLHQINKSYTNNYFLNSLLYVFLIGLLWVIYFIRKKYTSIQPINDESWFAWASKQFLFNKANAVVRPYHLLVNYTVVLFPTLIILLIMSYSRFPSLHDFKILPFYFLWAVFQQFILGYVLAQRIFYNRTKNRLLSSLLAAAVFSLFHMPSTSLMLLTFIAGGFWAYSWLVFRRFIPLALSHSVLALMFYATATDRFSYTAKVMQWFWE